MDVTDNEIVRVLDEKECSTLIHGHTHRPNMHNHTLKNGEEGVRVVLGDWDSSFWYAKIDNNEVDLIQRSLL